MTVPVRVVERFQATVDTSADGVLSLTGTLVSYGSVNENGYLWVPGAAAESLQARRQTGRPLTMGYQHHPLAPLTVIGRWPADGLDESVHGVTGAGILSDVQAGRDAATLLRDGAIDGISVGFCADGCQYLGPGETGRWQTPYGPFEFTAGPDQWVLAIYQADITEASIVHSPADDNARVAALTQATLDRAARAMPGLASDDPEDLRYSMALLMGGRGSGAFAELSDLDHYALYCRLADRYRQHGLTPPGYQRNPDYKTVHFQHDERDVFADRYLRKTLATLIAGAQGLRGPLSPDTRDHVQQALQALTDLQARQDNQPSLAEELRQLAARVEAISF